MRFSRLETCRVSQQAFEVLEERGSLNVTTLINAALCFYISSKTSFKAIRFLWLVNPTLQCPITAIAHFASFNITALFL